MMITIKEKIHTAVNQMNMSELALLYDHIRLLNEIKQGVYHTKNDIPIEKILEMTSSSKSCWSDTVIQERDEAI